MKNGPKLYFFCRLGNCCQYNSMCLCREKPLMTLPTPIKSNPTCSVRSGNSVISIIRCSPDTLARDWIENMSSLEIQSELHFSRFIDTIFLHFCLTSIGCNFASISLRSFSKNGGNFNVSPNVSISSSIVNPGPSVAISNRIPFDSRKYKLLK